MHEHFHSLLGDAQIRDDLRNASNHGRDLFFSHAFPKVYVNDRQFLPPPGYRTQAQLIPVNPKSQTRGVTISLQV
jgi:hypothetical protein